ncbi:hypothetical protein [Arthrobacter sp. Y-9]|uniref:hypothetical protein n=1 Tax=Arthrobacter sp. Y-9 TaxID=3039385 RepID=UPI00241F1372|nr:hypothetical protein [Arthrobacter sp. Y-9]WFR83460.1 hypothetical protein P9849_12980 [Arthrobacter sp. Y-9]
MSVQESRVISRRALLASKITFVTTVIGLIVAVVGLVQFAHQITDQNGVIAGRDKDIEKLNQQVQADRAILDSRQETITSLRAENTKLRAAVPYTVAPEDTHPVRSVATITLAKEGDTADLNSTLPNFRSSGNSWTDTLRFAGDEVRLGYGVSTLMLSKGPANYATCAAATGWEKKPDLDPHVLSNPTTCLRLDSGRYGAVQVRKYDSEKATLTITVWE